MSALVVFWSKMDRIAPMQSFRLNPYIKMFYGNVCLLRHKL